MQSRVSLTGVLAAILMFCITVAMHEATRADDLAGVKPAQGHSRLKTTGTQTSSGNRAPAQNSPRLRANFLSIPD